MPIQTNHNFNSPLRTLSTRFRPILPVFVAFGLILQFFTLVGGQDLNVKMIGDPKSSSVIEVTGRNAVEQTKLSFILAGFGMNDLGERVSDLNLFDTDGRSVGFKKFVAGEFVADRKFRSWSYKIDLAPSSLRSASAHISWITPTRGALMLDDILPQFSSTGKSLSGEVEVVFPANWRVFPARNFVKTSDLGKTVVYLGETMDIEPIPSNDRMSIVLDGEWYFSRAEAAKSANQIFSDYSKVFGSSPEFLVQIALLKYPNSVRPGEWDAEARGGSITIISSEMPFQSQSIQRLHEQLRHEMFHLWIPNGVNLNGNYDWFYEGFALYQSLRMGVAMNRIRFDDYLDTLGRAITTDRLHSNGVSLIDGSKNRFSGGNTTVYARGMVVAFLCDLALLEKSKGKRSVENILREIYQKHHKSPARTDGNEAVLSALAAYPELKPIIDRYIRGGEKVAPDEYFTFVGIEAQTQNSVTSLKVLPKPNSRQKDLLDKLGYNTWRKLANISK